MDQGRRKLYLVLLGLAALGLVVDRFVLTQSATRPASAAAAGAGLPSSAAGSANKNVSGSTSIPEIPFPKGLQTANSGSPILDLFARPEVRLRTKMGAGLSHNTDSQRRGAGSTSRASGSLFKSRHSLDGVLVQQRLKIAVLDGRPVRIGDKVDGCTLKEVSGYEARFECEDGPVALRLKDFSERSPG